MAGKQPSDDKGDDDKAKIREARCDLWTDIVDF